MWKDIIKLFVIYFFFLILCRSICLLSHIVVTAPVFAMSHFD